MQLPHSGSRAANRPCIRRHAIDEQDVVVVQPIGCGLCFVVILAVVACGRLLFSSLSNDLQFLVVCSTTFSRACSRFMPLHLPSCGC